MNPSFRERGAGWASMENRPVALDAYCHDFQLRAAYPASCIWHAAKQALRVILGSPSSLDSSPESISDYSVYVGQVFLCGEGTRDGAVCRG
jgi:hypothetical protein